MNQSAKRQHHEKARKQHRKELKQHEREVAKQPKSAAAAWVLAVGIGVMLVFVIGVAAAR